MAFFIGQLPAGRINILAAAASEAGIYPVFFKMTHKSFGFFF
jgi:hypothetical protein